jgi:hypothetical protein
MIGHSATPMVTNEILEILRIYPPHTADADGSKLTIINAATHRSRGGVQDLGCIRDAKQRLRLPRARRSARRFTGGLSPSSRPIPLTSLHATALPLSSRASPRDPQLVTKRGIPRRTCGGWQGAQPNSEIFSSFGSYSSLYSLRSAFVPPRPSGGISLMPCETRCQERPNTASFRSKSIV